MWEETAKRTAKVWAARFEKMANWFRSFADENEPGRKEVQIEPLLPVADSETYQRYADAFRTIIEKNVTCVAVTGPYGAGKTSLINTFCHHYPKLKFLRISLATFEGDDEQGISSDRIEKSILQQLIYSAGRGQLEYSRFKKIRKPSWLRTKAFLLSVFMLVTGAAIKYWDKVEKYAANMDHWLHYAFAAIGGLLWLGLFVPILHGTLKAGAGLSIRKLSLTNAEIETEDKSKESVFNKHLDEIVYFFQETACDIVIIEDLDRFGKTEIFTKIREINQLINANPDVRSKQKKPIIFLFAIRDDLFKGKDRTKFFDLLIPVIPFVSAGNAYDVLYNKLEKAGLRRGLQDKFLRQVTVYVTDNRHLVNIVNEYSLYRRALSETTLDPNRLFAVIIYKVFFPEDFGKLHMNTGVLSSLVGEVHDRRRKKREELERELNEINEWEEQARQGRAHSLESLVCAYVGAIQRRHRGQIRALRVGQRPETDIYGDTESVLAALQKGTEIRIQNPSNYEWTQISRAELEQLIHPGLTLADRLSEIDRATRLQEQGIATKRSVLERAVREARYIPMKDLFSPDEINERVSAFEHRELFVYLVMDGHLGEDYDYYTSYFHKGAITRDDREFVRRFNKGDEIDFSEKINTPSEILLILDDGLFGKPQGFNVTIVDHVLGEAAAIHRVRLIDGLKAFPNEAFRFLETYYAEGKHPEELLRILIESWDDFLEGAAGCENPLPHVKEILKRALDKTFSELRHSSTLAQIIERSAPDIFDNPDVARRLRLLAKSGLQISDISFPRLSDEERATAIEDVTEYGLWRMTPTNVATILAWQGVAAEAAESRMFRSLRDGPPTVLDHVEQHINDFVRNCFLEVEATVDEPQESIEKLLSVEGLETNLGERVIQRQKARIRFLNVPNEYWATVVREGKFVVDWANFEEFLADTDDHNQLMPVFSSPEVVSELAKEQREIDSDLFNLVVGYNQMRLDSYQKLVLPGLGKINELPSAIDREKKLHLIQSGLIKWRKDAYDWLKGEPELRVALLENQFSSFQEELDDWPLDKEELPGLLKSKIPLDGKRKLLLKAKAIECGKDAELQHEVLQILVHSEAVMGEFDEDFIERVIRNAPKGDGAELLTQMIPRWDEIRVLENLRAIGPPYDEIADHDKTLSIEDSKVNLALVEALKNRNFISEFKRDRKRIRIITKRREVLE